MKNQVIAVDLGGTNLRVAIVDGIKIKRLIKRKTPKTNLSREIIKEISKLMNSEIRGIGMGTPGFFTGGGIINSPNLKINPMLPKEVEKKFGKKVFTENDAKCAALAELKLGYGKINRNFIILTIGTGIGGGIVIDGKLYRGRGIAGEFSKIIFQDGKDFEFYSGVKGLKRFGRKKRGEYLGKGVAGLINIFDPEIVVLSGGAKKEPGLIENIRKETQKYAVRKNTPIVWSKLNEPGLLGASLLVK